MPDEVTDKGLTVLESQAVRVAELVSKGRTLKAAAKEVGVSVTELKRPGVLSAAVRGLLERTEAEGLLDKKLREKVAKARLVELMMQDEDPRVALGACKAELEANKPNVAIQFNQNLVTDPAVIEALKSLKIEVEEDGKAGRD